jgi:hypothetical protein
MPSKAQEFAASFTLDLGVDNTAHPSAVQPLGPAGALTASVNTRLSKTRGVPRKSPRAGIMLDPAPHAGSTAAGGVIPCGHVSSNLVMRHKRYGPQRIAGAELVALNVPLGGVVGLPSPGNHKPWAADVSRAGVVPFPAHHVGPAMCANGGFLWFAAIRTVTSSGSLGVHLTVLGPDGELVAIPRTVDLVTGGPGSPPWVGLTSHGGNGVRLWYRDGTTTAVFLSTVTVVAGEVTATAPVTVYTPIAASTWSGTYDVTAHDDSTAYLLTLGATLASDLALTKVNVATNTVANTTVWAASATISSRITLKSAAMSGGVRIGTAHVVGGGAGVCEVRLWSDAGIPALLFSTTAGGTLGTANEPFVGFYRDGSTEAVVYGTSDPFSGITAASFPATAGIYFELRNVSGGALLITKNLPWVRALSRPMMHSPAAGELYPLFCVQTCWDALNSQSPTLQAFLSDPDVRVLRIDNYTPGNIGVSCVGRFGVDTAAIYTPSDNALDALYNSQIACIEGNKFAFTYMERQVDFDLPDGATRSSTARYVEMDFAPRQPRFTVSADGTTLIAGAMTMEWDGVACAEICSPTRPKIAVAISGGSGLAPPAGNYILSAVHQWIDAAGILHRSMPAQPVRVTMAGGAWIVQVSVPSLLVHNGVNHEKYETLIYVSQAGGTVLYRQYATASTVAPLGEHVDTFMSVPAAPGDAVHPPIYSTGDPAEELMAQQPPGFSDVEVVSDRAWGIEAERPGRLWYSKAKVAGIAYEWSSDLKVDLPARAGRARAVVDLNGSPAALCERGVWVITGPGPDNALLSGGFNPPEQVSDIACTDRGSVIRTPSGVLFISNGRFAMVGAGGQRVFEQIDASQLGAVCPVLLRETHEAVWFSRNGVHMVYNYQLDRWSWWGPDTVPPVVCAARDPVSGYVNLVRALDGSVWQLDPQLSSLTAQLIFETGDIVFGGPEDDNVVNEVVLRAQSYGSHGVTFTLTNDYGQGEGSPFVRAYTPAEVAACTVNGQYTLSVSPGSMALRALRVTIVETDAFADGMGPLSLTVQGSRNGGTLRSAVRAAGRK